MRALRARPKGIAGERHRRSAAKQQDWYLKGVLTAIGAGLWVLILRPLVTPTRTQAAAPGVNVMQATELRAERVVIVNPQGSETARLERRSLSLGESRNGGRVLLTAERMKGRTAALQLFGEAGQPFAEVGIGANGAGIVRVSSKGGNTADMIADENGRTTLRLSAGNLGQTSIALGADTDEALLALGAADGHVTLGNRENLRGLFLTDRGGERRASMYLEPDGSPRLHLRDKDQKDVFHAP